MHIRNLLNSVGQLCPVAELVEQVQQNALNSRRNRTLSN